MSTCGWDIRFFAERQPDVAGGDPAREGLIGGTTERTENEVPGEHPTVAFAELVFQSLTELAQSHAVLTRLSFIRVLRVLVLRVLWG